MATALDIIVHKDDTTGEDSSWGIVYEDGAVQWYDSLEEAEYYFDKEDE